MGGKIATGREQVIENIKNYGNSVNRYPGLAKRIRQHPAWYAVHVDGKWMFGPSKFIGYAEANAESYLRSYHRKDGRETEPALKQWFEEVPPDSPLWKVLHRAFNEFASQFGKSAKKTWRVSILKPKPDEGLVAAQGHTKAEVWLKRITSDPNICGGRPCIAGTRMRVSDIVGMIAEGVSRDEVLADFPYITDEDVTAALAYAARAVDHRVDLAA
jgi:uncharacterized protein (DUF433 family)